MLRHAEDAEDAVQETFLRALRSLAGFRARAGLRTWLFRIAVNVCLEWKRRGASAAVPVDADLAAGTEPSLEAAALDRLQLLQALQVLHPRQRAMLLLKELEGCTAAEIGAALRCSQRRVYHELEAAHAVLAAWRRRMEEGE